MSFVVLLKEGQTRHSSECDGAEDLAGRWSHGVRSCVLLPVHLTDRKNSSRPQSISPLVLGFYLDPRTR